MLNLTIEISRFLNLQLSNLASNKILSTTVIVIRSYNYTYLTTQRIKTRWNGEDFVT